jgi:hypothetical protein
MFCGVWRTPPGCPVFTGRPVVLLCILVFLLVGRVAPAQAYVCAPGSMNGHRVAEQRACEQSTPVWRKHGEATPMSFVFFLGAVAAVLLIPVAFRRREDLQPE